MITVISGTNRKGSEALLFARTFADLFRQQSDEEVHLIELENIPHDYFFPEMYESDAQAVSLSHLQDRSMIPADKFFFVVPEYNGSFPGALKLFIDACSVREYSGTFKGKKAAIAGVASGRAGNLRGLDQLTHVLNHVGTVVMPNRLPISGITKLTRDDEIHDPATLKAMETLVKEFLLF
jgi:chromate reductase